MKLLIKPLLRIIGLLLQTIIAILLTIVWGISTLLLIIVYSTFFFVWEFKIKTYKFDNYYEIKYDSDSITCQFLWAKEYRKYKTYFHCIWNLSSQKPILTQLTNRIKLLWKQ